MCLLYLGSVDKVDQEVKQNSQNEQENCLEFEKTNASVSALGESKIKAAEFEQIRYLVTFKNDKNFLFTII